METVDPYGTTTKDKGKNNDDDNSRSLGDDNKRR
jgi:hypothetical protein